MTARSTSTQCSAALRRTVTRDWIAFEYEWNEWQGNNRVDVLSETLALKRRLARFDAVPVPTAG